MEKYLDAKAIMSALGVGRSTVYSLLKREDFPASRIGKRIVVSETSLREWMAQGGTERREARV